MSKSPDIYYIVLDGFAGGPALWERFGFDLSPFTGRLEALGFRVLEHSFSNYTRTTAAIPSVLNMNYLALKPYRGNKTPEGAEAIDIRKKFRVADWVQANGYQLYTYAPWFPFSGIRRGNIHSRCLNKSVFTPFLETLVKTSLFSLAEGQLLKNLNVINALLPGHVIAKQHRKTLECLFRKTEVLAQQNKGPKFVFVHLLSPHPPFVFGKVKGSGSSFLNPNLGAASHGAAEEYLEQIRYLSEFVPSWLERILEGSKRPSIIVLQADHGSRYSSGQAKEPVENPSISALREQFNILNAVYGPKELLAQFKEPFTAVNTFRVLKSFLTQSSVPLLPDHLFYLLGENDEGFIEVTDRVLEDSPGGRDSNG